MELDDLKQAWQTLDKRLQQQHALSLELFAQNRIAAAKSGLLWFKICRLLQIALGMAMIVFFATFWVAHRDNAVLMLSGMVMHAYSVVFTIAGFMEGLILTRTSYARPVVTIQKSLTYLKVWRGRMMPWLGLSWWLLWIPLTLISFAALFGVDLWKHAPDVVGWFLGIGIAGLLATCWLIYWSPLPLRKRVRDYLDESNLSPAVKRAQSILGEIERFQQE